MSRLCWRAASSASVLGALDVTKTAIGDPGGMGTDTTAITAVVT